MRIVRTLFAVILAGSIVTACSDPISGAGSCPELEGAWLEEISDPDLTGDELDEIIGNAIVRASELAEEAEENNNPLQEQACSDLLVDLAFTGGAVNPTFESCPDGTIAPIGEC